MTEGRKKKRLNSATSDAADRSGTDRLRLRSPPSLGNRPSRPVRDVKRGIAVRGTLPQGRTWSGK